MLGHRRHSHGRIHQQLNPSYWENKTFASCHSYLPYINYYHIFYIVHHYLLCFYMFLSYKYKLKHKSEKIKYSYLPYICSYHILFTTKLQVPCLHLMIKTFGKPGLQLQKEGNLYIIDGLVWFMVFSTIFNNILVISWQSVLLVEETGVPGENPRPVVSHWQILSHNIVSSTLRHQRGSNSQL